MKDIIALQEKIGLLEQELKTLTDKVIKLEERLHQVEDINIDLKGLKVFFGRVYPEFKSQFPDIVKKLRA
jgi:argonaute-like protein implicated in RNA metabolism and viral defense